MDHYFETKEVINSMAKVKMDMNSHKGRIEDCKPSDIIRMMRAEIDELEIAIDAGTYMDVITEAADVQNFLVGLVSQQIAQYRSRK